MSTKLVDLTDKVNKTSEDLQIVQKDYDKNKKLMEDRLVVMYECGDISYLDLILVMSVEPGKGGQKLIPETLEKVKELNADVGVAFDGDGDRMGVISSTGKFIPTDKYMIIVIRDIINKVENKKFLYDVKCSKSLSDEITKLGGESMCYRTGNSYTKAAVRDYDLPFGGELSGHVYFRDRWPGFDSGLYAGLRLLELLSKTDKRTSQLLDGITNYYSTEEIKISSPDKIKFTVVDKIVEYCKEKGYNINTIDGVRATFNDGWALVRCSNTGPNITVRFEAETQERLEEIQKEFLSKIEEYNQE